MAIVMVDAGIDIRGISLARPHLPGDANRQRAVDQRKIDGALPLRAAVVAAQHLRIPADCPQVRPAWLEQNGAARGISAKERALRPVEGFHGLQVVVQPGTGHPCRDLGEVAHHCGTASRSTPGVQSRLTLPAQAEELLAAPMGVFGHVCRRYEQLQVGERLNVLPLQRLRVDSRYGDRHLLQRLAAPPRRHDDLLHLVGACVGRH